MASPLHKATLVTKSGTKAAPDALQGKVVAIYFSAHWCPPCRGFTPVLRTFYEKLKEKNEQIEIVFVSGDKSQDEFLDYFKNQHGDWLAVEFGSQACDDLNEFYKVRGIPSLVVVNAKGESVVSDARGEVQGCGDKVEGVFKAWKEAAGDWRETAGQSLGGGSSVNDAAAMRAARLARLGGGPAPAANPPAAASPTPASAPASAPSEAPTPSAAAPATYAAPAPAPAAPNQAAMDNITGMGFTTEQAANALSLTNGNVEQAIEILLSS